MFQLLEFQESDLPQVSRHCVIVFAYLQKSSNQLLGHLGQEQQLQQQQNAQDGGRHQGLLAVSAAEPCTPILIYTFNRNKPQNYVPKRSKLLTLSQIIQLMFLARQLPRFQVLRYELTLFKII